VAVESQPVQLWRQRALSETDIDAKLTALLALARKGTPREQAEVLAHLNAMDASALSADNMPRLLRAYELALARGDDAVEREKESSVKKLRPLFPHTDPRANRELSRLLCYLRDTSVIDPLLRQMAGDTGEQPILGSGYFVRNSKYGKAIQDILEAAPLIDRMHHAQMLLWMDDGWTYDQRAEYFRLIADAAASSKGGHWYAQFWERIRAAAMDQVPSDLRERFESIAAVPVATFDEENLPRPEGPGRQWTLDELLLGVQDGLKNRDFENGKKMFSAATCISCHRFQGEGSSVGPDLSSLGARFTLRDILDATVNPSKAVSDQYRVSMIETSSGRTITGRVVSRDEQKITIATNLRRPSQTTDIESEDVEEESSIPVSTMPTELLNPLNEEEVLDLVAYLVSGGDERHPVFLE
jgi:putative heme-binding domain-containing protein